MKIERKQVNAFAFLELFDVTFSSPRRSQLTASLIFHVTVHIISLWKAYLIFFCRLCIRSILFHVLHILIFSHVLFIVLSIPRYLFIYLFILTELSATFFWLHPFLISYPNLHIATLLKSPVSSYFICRSIRSMFWLIFFFSCLLFFQGTYSKKLHL